MDAARKALTEHGKAFTVTPVIAAELENRPGAFHELLSVLDKAGMSLEYTYAFLSPINGKAEVVLRTADRHVTLPDGAQDICVSGAALMAGVRLLPLFRGTGYDPKQRTLNDFGSDLFVIEQQEL